jgi:manganese/zinc/iron transport system permease protein
MIDGLDRMIGEWSMLHTWIVVIGVLAASACALLGCFMVLRRMSMMGDAISHAVLPGLAAAFLLTVLVQNQLRDVALPEWLDAIVSINARSGPVMFVGAAIVGVLTAFFTQLVHEKGRVEHSAAMGVVFTTLFAIGLILMVRAADQVDLDPGCVLYGGIELAPLDEVTIGSWAIPRAVVVLTIVGLIDLAFVVAFFKELKITSFDPALATTLGIRASVMHYLLMTLIAITTVAAFEAVGSILVVAMLIVPAATAHQLTDRLWTMLVTAVIVAGLGAGLGHVAAITVPDLFGYPDTSTAGSMAVVSGVLFVIALLLAPRHGIVVRVLQRRALGLSILREDILGLLYRLEEHGIREPAATLRSRVRAALGAGPLTTRLAIARLARRGLVARASGTISMTERGRQQARRLVRSHRLWESYLVKHLALAPDHVHSTAMRLEHVTGDAMREHLAQQVDDADVDPHGRAIPDGERGNGG